MVDADLHFSRLKSLMNRLTPLNRHFIDPNDEQFVNQEYLTIIQMMRKKKLLEESASRFAPGSGYDWFDVDRRKREEKERKERRLKQQERQQLENYQYDLAREEKNKAAVEAEMGTKQKDD